MAWIKINDELYSNSISPHILFLQDGIWLVKKTNYDTDLELPIEDVYNNPIGTQEILFADGNELEPSITFQNAPSTGIFRDINGNLSFAVNGKNRFLIEPTGQIKAVYESTVGTDFNTQLDNGYLCRAWVNFDGTGTVAIRASGNASSITDHGTGDYSANFLSPMPDKNYACVVNGALFTSAALNNYGVQNFFSSQNVSSVRLSSRQGTEFGDSNCIVVGIFR